ncbi:MAG: hypothetical protein WDN67_00230 [Candidatus Moraniibacteriota bacterium]
MLAELVTPHPRGIQALFIRIFYRYCRMKVPLESLQSMVRCMICNKKHRPAKMVVLEEDEKRTALYLSCDGCGTASLVFFRSARWAL